VNSPAAARRNPLARWLADRRVTTKILLVVTALAAVSAGVGGTALVQMSSLNAHAAMISESNVVSLAALDRLRAAAERTEADVAGLVIAHDTPAEGRYEQALRTDDETVAAAFAAYTSDAMPQQRWKDNVRTFTESWAAYQKARDEVVLPLVHARKNTEFRAARESQTQPQAAKALAALADLAEYEQADARSVAAVAASTYGSARLSVILTLVLGLTAAIGLALYVGALIRRPLQEVASVLTAVADGDLTRAVHVDSRDELGVMGSALTRATDSMRQAIAAMAGTAGTLATAAADLTATSQQIADSAEHAASQSGVVSAAAEQVSANVQTVSAGAEEMGASIREIAHNANEAAKVAAQAVDVAAATTGTVSKLGESSTEIAGVVKVITSIAGQTNLLALNATIEAARAGEAGKGFAVVATEVKELAQETARATEDISRRVEAIQGDTAGAVEAIAEISAIIGKINDYQLTIASAVEEQSATTGEMNRNVAEAATGAGQIAQNIAGVATSAAADTQRAEDAHRHAETLVRASAELQTLVGRFRH
jgi:methyl-accepting chemotaxis protein